MVTILVSILILAFVHDQLWIMNIFRFLAYGLQLSLISPILKEFFEADKD
jgi:hypothetical protein